METMITTETKVCSKCKQALPVSMFHKNIKRPDGLQTYCKECGKEYAQKRKRNGGGIDSTVTEIIDGHKLTKVHSNPDLTCFTPRQLMQELKARGYRWDYMIEPQRKIMYDKI